MEFKNTILLTGAGFTANYGGFLAREMWSKIFNNPKLNGAGKIKLDLHDNFDFEKLYSDVFDNQTYPQNEGAILTTVLNEAYEAQEKNIDEVFYEINSELVNFLKCFTEKDENFTGVCFTLNQDLFFEKKLGWQPFGPQLQYPFDSRGDLVVNTSDTKIVPGKEEIKNYEESFNEDFCYIKLHGSVNWVTKDGDQCKVLGINKPTIINNIPLLNWYYNLFKKSLNRKDVKLVIVGYSFNDEHINDCIWEAAKLPENNLSIYIISPEDPFFFHKRFIYKENMYSINGPQIIKDPDIKRVDIWRATKGYFPYKLSDMFSNSINSSARRNEFYTAIG